MFTKQQIEKNGVRLGYYIDGWLIDRMTLAPALKAELPKSFSVRDVIPNRLVARIQIPGQAESEIAVVDTGAAFSIFPFKSWRLVERNIHFLSAPAIQALATMTNMPSDGFSKVEGIGGAIIAARYGVIEIRIYPPLMDALVIRGPSSVSVPYQTVTVLGAFVYDGIDGWGAAPTEINGNVPSEEIDSPLLGLGGGGFRRGGLCLNLASGDLHFVKLL